MVCSWSRSHRRSCIVDRCARHDWRVLSTVASSHRGKQRRHQAIARVDAVVRTQRALEAVPRLANTVVDRIASGALNGQSVAELAATLGTSDRHLRRALKREHGTAPARLAVAQRLRAATALLADPRRSITDVAFASGFGSIRRFNAAFRGQFQMSPTAWRRVQSPTK